MRPRPLDDSAFQRSLHGQIYVKDSTKVAYLCQQDSLEEVLKDAGDPADEVPNESGDETDSHQLEPTSKGR